MIGRQISHFEILEKLGEGGMGVVYKARDLRLNRLVALKFLSAETTADPDRRRRFTQEARAASALNHPHIITIYDIAEDDGQQFIAMEHVAGVTLDTVLAAKGKPLPIDDALGYAIQIADALAAAHGAGIVHRDLKPGNAIVTDAGQVKVLDFGLAKLADPPPAGGGDQTLSQSVLTQHASIVGTVAYMSPEQAEGKVVDRRSDIFSFGTMLYEMVSGRRPFAGETPMSTLASVVHAQPPTLAQDLSGVPPELRRIIARCLRKDVALRFQHMDDVKVALIELRDELRTTPHVAVTPPAPTAPRGRRYAAMALAGALAGAIGASTVAWWRRPDPAAPPMPLVRVTADDGLTTDPALSPDGKLVAYASDRAARGDGDLSANTDIWVQQVGGGEAIRLTQDPADDNEPSFSPDGSHLVFRSDRDGGGLYIVSSFGGQARFLVRGGHYPRFSPDGASIAYWDGEPASGILFVSGDARIFVIPSDGGTPQPFRHDFAVAYPPQWLDDSKRLLFWGRRKATEDADWWVAPIGEGEPRVIGGGDALRGIGTTDPALVSAVSRDQRLVFSAGRNLWQLPIDEGRQRSHDSPQPVTFGTASDRHPALAEDGRIAFHSGATSIQVWSVPLDANGAHAIGPPVQLTTGSAAHQRPFVAADGTTIAFSSDRSGNMDAWVKDLRSNVEQAVAVSSDAEQNPVLSPDSTRVAYLRTDRAGAETLFIAPVSGGAPENVCRACSGWHQWSSDGQAILSLDRRHDRFGAVLIKPDGQEIWRVEHSTFNLFGPRLSPDGRWLAVSVNRGQGKASIWLVPISGTAPAPERQWLRLTAEDGFADKQDWSPNGNVLYYYSRLDGFGCLYAQRLDPATKQPRDAPIGISHWHGARRSLHNVGLGWLNVSVARDKIVFNVAEQTGNIWMLRPAVKP